ncbi:MAG TPA: hypothetical protein VGM39_00190 [Kofleriaceae bacterium]|jgi:hypothetical protein
MSSLAFDKQGKPFAWHKRTAKLRVRLFRNPSARGTCCQVLDGAGVPLFVDADIDYTEFRRAVSGVPGLYRLDQCDEDGVEIEDAAPAYVSIEQLRNAGGVVTAENSQVGDVSPLLIIERLVALQSDVMKTMATQHAAILASSAEIMRAPYRPVPLLPATELRNADAANENGDDEDDEDDDEIVESNAFAPMLSMLEPHLPQLGAFLYTKFVEFFRQVPAASATTPPAATSNPMPATAPMTASSAPRVVTVPMDVAARYEPADAGFASELFEASVINAEMSPDIYSAVPTDSSTGDVRNQSPMATPEQLAHLFAVRERLSPAEQALVEHVIKRMPPELLIQYLGSLSAMPLDDATAFVRSLIAQARPERGSKPR